MSKAKRKTPVKERLLMKESCHTKLIGDVTELYGNVELIVESWLATS